MPLKPAIWRFSEEDCLPPLSNLAYLSPMMLLICCVTGCGYLLWIEFQFPEMIWASWSSRPWTDSLLYVIVLYYDCIGMPTGLFPLYRANCSTLGYGWFKWSWFCCDWRPFELVCEAAPNWPVLCPELHEPFGIRLPSAFMLFWLSWNENCECVVRELLAIFLSELTRIPELFFNCW